MASASQIKRRLRDLAGAHPQDPTGELAALVAELAGIVDQVEVLANTAIAALDDANML